MKNKLRIKILILSILLVLIYYVNWSMGNNIDFDKLNLLISFIGLFSTFGGAYLGAKISGNNAISLTREERKYDNSKNILTSLRALERIKERLLEKIRENIEVVASLKEGGYRGLHFRPYENEYDEWKQLFSDIKVNAVWTNLTLDDINPLQEPSYLSTNLAEYVDRFVKKNVSKSGVTTIDGVEFEELREYERGLSKANENLKKLQNDIDRVESKIMTQFEQKLM